MIHQLGRTILFVGGVTVTLWTSIVHVRRLQRDASALHDLTRRERRAGVFVGVLPTVLAGVFVLAVFAAMWRWPAVMAYGFLIAAFGVDGVRWLVTKMVRLYPPARRVTDPAVARAQEAKLAASRSDEARLQSERDFSEQIARKRVSA